jgi:hypothetical protein
VELEEAKEIYFQYQGSTFFMTRDGVDYTMFLEVPHEVLTEWDAEIKDLELAKLGLPGNVEALSFLAHHGYFEHLGDVLATPPLGRLWQRCAYLEQLLIFLDCCSDDRYPPPNVRYEPQTLWAALEWVIAQAAVVRRRARSKASYARVDRIVAEAQSRLEAVTNADGSRAGLWRWYPLTRTAEPVPEPA